jgi:hypothetical protein
MKAFHWQVVGCLAMALIALLALNCSLSSHAMRGCMRAGLYGAFAYSLHIGAMAMGCWAWHEAFSRSRRAWLAWTAGLLVFFILSAFLYWVGIEFPSSQDE